MQRRATSTERPEGRRLPAVAGFPFVWAFAGVALVLGALGLLYVLARHNHQILDKGPLLPYTSAEVYRLRLFDWFTVYAQPERKTTLDIVHSWLLVAVSSFSFLTVILLWRTHAGEGRRLPSFFFLSWLGAGFLAVDEIVGLHENIGHNLRFLRDLPLIERPDDAVLVVYLVVALAFITVFRDILIRSRPALFLFGLAFAVFIAASLADVLDVGQREEVIEVVAASALVVGFCVLAVEEVRRAANSAGLSADRR